MIKFYRGQGYLSIKHAARFLGDVGLFGLWKSLYPTLTIPFGKESTYKKASEKKGRLNKGITSGKPRGKLTEKKLLRWDLMDK